MVCKKFLATVKEMDGLHKFFSDSESNGHYYVVFRTQGYAFFGGNVCSHSCVMCIQIDSYEK